MEARRGRELFGTERVADLLRRHRELPTAELADVVLDAVRAFHGGTLVDDLAMLLIRNTGRW